MLLKRPTGHLTYTPRNNFVLVKQLDPEERSPGGVVIPETARENIAMGKVVAMGPGKELPIPNRGWSGPIPYESGKTPPSRYEPIEGIKVGDVVFFNMRRTIPVSPNPSDTLGMVDADDIMATVKFPAPEDN